MAIPYLRVYHCHLDSGACELISYLGRRVILDIRLAKQFDHRHLGIDLVHEEIIRCEGVSAAFADPQFLANGIDETEASHVRTPLDQRVRKPQIGAALVLALPPDDEITLSEATELTRRIARSIASDRRLAIHAAIHDRALAMPGSRNRHGHLLFPGRQIKDDEFDGLTIRDMFARPLRFKDDGSTVTVEGNRWPDSYSREQNAFFAELGIELVVDPIAPFPGRHWPTNVPLDHPRVLTFATRNKALNVEAIQGDPQWLVNKLLRGQSTIPISGLQRLIEKFIDNESDRRIQLDAIVGGPAIVTYAADAQSKARYITTASVAHSIQRACELVDRAALEAGGRSIHAFSAANHSGIVDVLGQHVLSHMAADRPLLLGNNHSECHLFSRRIASCRPVISTIKAALSGPPTKATDNQPATPLSANRILIVPRSEAIDDQTFAQLILKAAEWKALLILGHDQSKETGIASNRLAAYAAARLAVVQKHSEESPAAAIERWLRAGLLGPAIELMAQHHEIQFEPTGQIAESGDFDFVVCNDSRRLKLLNDELRLQRLKQRKIDPSVSLGHPLKPISLSRNEWIVFTRTDYSVRPPRVRAGELAQVIEIDGNLNKIIVLLSDGGIVPIQLMRFANFRSAHALLVREARFLDQQRRLRIEVTDANHVWATLLLAAGHRLAKLVIDPQVATDLSALIRAAHASVPAPLPQHLALSPDPATSELELLEFPMPLSDGDSEKHVVPWDTSQLERPLKDGLTTIPKSPSGVPMHERVRAILAFNSHTRLGFAKLLKKLSNDNPDRDANAEHILSLCRVGGPTAALVKLLMHPPSTIQPNFLADLDWPREIEQELPNSWDEWDLYLMRVDLSTMQWDFSSWNVNPTRPAPSFSSRSTE